MSECILIVDDEPNILKVLRTVLEREGYTIRTAESGEAALAALAERKADAMLTDLKMAGMDGLALLQAAREADPSLPVILMTAHGTIETAVEAMKRGAFDYLTKPVDNTALRDVLEKALDARSLRDADLTPVETSEPGPSAKSGGANARPGESAFVGQSAAARTLLDTAKRAAAVDSTVLLTGETGTGKEVIARMLHSQSPRRAGPFQAVNCAALPAHLIESELFGYEKGAFTGAANAKPGRFELADGGTLMLDEIGEMPLEVQPKLLRALQERTFERVGAVKSRTVDVRVIAATNRDLKRCAAEGTFREDLFYRLNVIPLRLAPLRERKEDIGLLVDHFCARLAKRFGGKPRKFSPEALESLLRYDWPGNVRELENLIERLAVLEAEGEIQSESVNRELEQSVRPLPASTSSIKDQVGSTSEAVEVQMIKRALDENRNNRTHAASDLGISRRTLQLKMKKYGMQDKEGVGGRGA